MTKENTPWFIEGSKQPIPKEVLEAHQNPSPQTIQKINSLEIRLSVMDEKLDNILEVSQRTETQTIKTNGRVTALEMWKAGLQGEVKGSWFVIAIVGFGVFQVFLKFLN